MKISIEEKSGFCSGVLGVVKLADDILDRGEELYCLGQIVHNDLEVKRLIDKGLKFIDYEDLTLLHHCKVLFRAHGEPPETYQIARNNNIEIIDGTCPIVKKIQERIKKVGVNQEQIIIFGKVNHPEVRGLRTQVPYNVTVINSVEEANEVQLSDKVHLYAQTTMDADSYKEVSCILNGRVRGQGGQLMINKTICRHVSHRKPGLKKFARNNDIIIFIAGINSSNGRMLFETCRKENPQCYFVTHIEVIKKEWFLNAGSIGICGATSTPRWQIEEAYEKIGKLTRTCS